MIRHLQRLHKMGCGTTKGYTLLELVFVIVILGIVSSIGSEIIAKVYENYIVQRAVHRASIKTELAAQQIANLLRYRIPGTTIARNPNNFSDNAYVTDQSNDHDYQHTVLEWIGADADSFNAATLPGWSGFCDVNASDQAKVITPGSQLTLTKTIMKNLSKNAAGTSTAQRPIIFFRSKLYAYNSATGSETHYNALPDTSTGEAGCLGMIDNNTSCVSPVELTDDNTTLTFNSPGSAAQKVIAEHYKLAWSAYAIIPYKSDGSGVCTPGDFTASGEVHCDLKLFYNYQPWEGERLSSTPLSSIPHATLVRNVTVFKFAQSGNVFRIKICAQESYGNSDYNTTICKEKAVLR